MINLVKPIRFDHMLSFVQIHIFVGLYTVTWHVLALDLADYLFIGIGSSLPIPCRSLLLHTYHTRSIIVFCIGRALPIRSVRVIRKSSRYTLEFDGLLFPCQFIGQIDCHALVQIKCSPGLAYGAPGLGLWSSRVNSYLILCFRSLGPVWTFAASTIRLRGRVSKAIRVMVSRPCWALGGRRPAFVARDAAPSSSW